MKRFEEWWKNKNTEDIDFKGDGDEITYQDIENYTEKGWRAALEEILKQTKRINRGRIGIIDWIEKELKNDQS